MNLDIFSRRFPVPDRYTLCSGTDTSPRVRTSLNSAESDPIDPKHSIYHPLEPLHSPIEMCVADFNDKLLIAKF